MHPAWELDEVALVAGQLTTCAEAAIVVYRILKEINKKNDEGTIPKRFFLKRF